MNVGIPTWNGRVSPVLDVAKRLVLAAIEGNAVVGRREVDLEEGSLGAKVRQIRDLGVQTLICGAVSWPLEAALLSTGVRVLPQTCGPVEDVLRAFASGRLTDETYRMPGCCGRRRRARRRGGRGRLGSGMETL
ncbi:MAG: dinitrogenase iron-molybdenum cofactor biosynthesis protein [Planctomycetes bacterium]|nr:dinitrogenase iron-molybdenum cofactor biosynthesis protein [Planctomycetota bacterium]